MPSDNQAPSDANLGQPPSEGNPPQQNRSDRACEAVVALTLPEIARVGVAMGRLRLWCTGQLGDPLTGVDLDGLEAAAALIADIRDQIERCGRPPEDSITYPPDYSRLAILMGVPWDPSESGAVTKLARRCVAKLEHDKLRQG